METILNKNFYTRDTATVAKELLGNILVRKYEKKKLEGVIVETEAYYGEDDPASRAYQGKKKYNKVMFENPGHLFIYNVHQYWMLNFIAHKPNLVGGVLIRALEPKTGISTMKKNRPVSKIIELTSGPGKLSVALGISKDLNGLPAYSESNPVFVKQSKIDGEIGYSNRIGVTQDLKHKLRFYIKKNPFLSKKEKN
jgi:DNA-3-methyladenine glycosylase